MINDSDILMLARQAFEAETGEDSATLIEIARLTLSDEEYQRFLAHLLHLRQQNRPPTSNVPACLRLSAPLPCARMIAGQPCGRPAEVAVLAALPSDCELMLAVPTLEPTWAIAPVCPACVEAVPELAELLPD